MPCMRGSHEQRRSWQKALPVSPFSHWVQRGELADGGKVLLHAASICNITRTHMNALQQVRGKCAGLHAMTCHQCCSLHAC